MLPSLTPLLVPNYSVKPLFVFYTIYCDFIHLCVCVLMPTHCTITRFGFHARWIDGIKCGLFLNHALLRQTTLLVG